MTTLPTPAGPFVASARVPSDKSLSHRALVLAAMAEGQSRVSIEGTGADVKATRDAIGALGAEVVGDRVLSRGVAAWRAPRGPIDCGNSGTTMRILAGALAGSRLTVVLEGDDSLSRRPMRRIAHAVAPLGGRIDTTASGTPPITVTGGPLTGAEVSVPIASAQVRTAVALAAVDADGPTTLDSPPGFRDHTERWLEAMDLGERRDGTRFVVRPGPVPPIEVTVPRDASSAAFLWVAAALVPGSTVTTPEVTLNPGRTGILTVLERMGARVEVEPNGLVLGDPWGTVTVSGDGLGGIEVSGALTAACLDELPLVAVLGAVAEGETIVSDAAELRVKETDRIAASVRLIDTLGGSAEETGDGFVVRQSRLTGGLVRPEGDHRIAMAAAVAAFAAAGPTRVEELQEVAAVSWPGFTGALEALWS